MPATSPHIVTIALAVRRTGPDGKTIPFAGVLLEAKVDEGQGRLEQTFVTADSRGIASVGVVMPADGDKTRVEVALERDRRSWLPFEVVSAPIVDVEMPVGAIRDIEAPRDGVLLRLPASPTAEYFLIPHQTDGDRSGAAYRFLRQTTASRPGDVALGDQGLAVQAGASSLGVPDEFGLDAIDPHNLVPSAGVADRMNIRSCRINAERDAPLRYLGQRIALYVDAARDLHQARIDSLGRAFDGDIFPLNTRLFGPTTDLDGNERVIVVLSPELQGNGGAYCDTIRTIGVEAFYGTWTPTDPIDRPLSTLAHEHQHVINAGYHLRSRNAIGDDRWLNEGMSFAAEALHGYWGGPILRMWLFLGGQNSGLSALPLDYAPAFADEYMMFLLYLRDRFGPDTYLALGRSGKAGVPNVEAVTGVAFEALLHDWFVANAVSNSGLTDDPRFNYESVDLHGMAAEIANCDCVPPARFGGLNMEMLRLSSPFDVWRRLDRADADYYRLLADGNGEAEAQELYYDAFGLQTTKLTIVRAR